MDSILNDIKKKLGIAAEYDHFDIDIIDAINNAFATLVQHGVGNEKGFEIADDTAVWTDFINDMRLNFVRTYVWLSVKVVFDPPTSSAVLQSYENRMRELEWRMFVVKDNDRYDEENESSSSDDESSGGSCDCDINPLTGSQMNNLLNLINKE